MPALWVCTACAANVEGDRPPEKCPQCGADGEDFAQWATNNDYPKHTLGLKERQGLPAAWWEEGKAFAKGRIYLKKGGQ